MADKGKIIVGIALAAVIVALSKASAAGGTGAGSCKTLVPGQRYEFFYTGPRISVFDLLGECYPVVYYLEIYNEETGDWDQPSNPQIDYVESNSQVAVMVQASCKMCGF